MAVYDASWKRPAPSLLKPGDGIILYCSRTDAKVPSPDECVAYRKHGVEVGFVFEDAADRAATHGYNDGRADGLLARSMAANRGHPRGKPIYFACDVISPVNLEYARGFRDGLGGGNEARLYAGDRNLERARAGLGLRLGWQAASGSWSDHFYLSGQEGGHGTYPAAALWQVIGTSTVPGTDINIVHDHAWNGDDVTSEEHDALMYLKSVFTRIAEQGQFEIPAGQASVGGTLAAILPAIQGNSVQAIRAAIHAELQASEQDLTAVINSAVAAGGDPATVAATVLDMLKQRLAS